MIVALLISGLRLMLPKLNDYCPQLLAQVEKLSGVPVQMDFLQGSWETFGPQLEVRNLSVTLPKSDVHIERVTLALDVWQSLLHWRWQFRDPDLLSIPARSERHAGRRPAGRRP